MTVSEEKSKALEALKTALTAKLKKQLVLSSDSSKQPVKLKRILSPPQKVSSPTSDNNNMTSMFEKGQINSNRVNVSNIVKGKKFLQISITDTSSFLLNSPKSMEPLTAKAKINTSQPNINASDGIFITSPINHGVNKSDLLTEGNDTLLQNSNILNRSSKTKEKVVLQSDLKLDNMLKNASHAQSAMLLPIFQDTIQSSNNKQMYELNERVEHLHRMMDDLKHQNQIALKDFNRFKILDQNLGYQLAAIQGNESIEKKNQLSQDIEKAKEQLEIANLQKDRLTKIINICQKNKKHNQLWIKKLNFLAQNINKTLQRENDEISKNTLLTQDLMKILIDMKKAFEDKKENQRRLVGHLNSQKEMKEVIDEKVDIAYKDIEKSAADVHEKLIDGFITTQAIKRNNEKIDRRRNSNDSIEDLDETINKKNKLKEIISDPIKFQDFLFGVSKNEELRAAIIAKESEVAKLREELDFQKKTIDILQKASQYDSNEQQHPVPYSEVDDKEELKKLLKQKLAQRDLLERNKERTTNLVLQANMSFAKMCQKNGIKIESNQLVPPQLPVDPLLNIILDKIKDIKDHLSEEEFDKFEKGEYKYIPPSHKFLEIGSRSLIIDNTIKEAESKGYYQYYRLGNKLVAYNDHF